MREQFLVELYQLYQVYNRFLYTVKNYTEDELLFPYLYALLELGFLYTSHY
jgi:hypothetical protein